MLQFYHWNAYEGQCRFFWSKYSLHIWSFVWVSLVLFSITYFYPVDTCTAMQSLDPLMISYSATSMGSTSFLYHMSPWSSTPQKSILSPRCEILQGECVCKHSIAIHKVSSRTPPSSLTNPTDSIYQRSLFTVCYTSENDHNSSFSRSSVVF